MGAAFGERYRRLASRDDGVGTAVKAAANLVDRTASSVAHMLRQYPLARLAAFMYLAAIHLYVYWLTLRMQHAATALLQRDATTHGVSGLGAAAATGVDDAASSATTGRRN
jgi:hypothetical protein